MALGKITKLLKRFQSPPGQSTALPDISVHKGKLVCAKIPKDFRDFQRVEAVQSWAETHGIKFDTVDPAQLKEYHWQENTAVWLPFINPGEDLDFTERFYQVAEIPKEVPIVVDIKSKSEHPWLVSMREALKDRHLGCRHVSPSDTGDLFGEKAQYNHWPRPAPPSEVHDIVMFDIHNWEAMSRHLQIVGLIERMIRDYEEICAITGVKVKFYLTSFTDSEPYGQCLKTLFESDYRLKSDSTSWSDLSKLHSFFIPPAETRDDFVNIFSRTRCVFTFHENISDMLLFESLSNEIPTIILPTEMHVEKPSTLWVPDRHDVPGYHDWAVKVEQSLRQNNLEDYQFLNTSRTDFNSDEILRRAFSFAWIQLWNWSMKCWESQR